MFEEEKKTYTKDMKKRLENYRYSLFYKTITIYYKSIYTAFRNLAFESQH